MILLMGIFMISMASAFEFDNIKSYDPVTREVTIINALGLGSEIGKARLNSPLIVRVPAGYQKVGEFELWAYEDYNDILKQLTFKDVKNEMNEINRDFDFKYKTYENGIEDIFEEVLIGYTENRTEIYELRKVGEKRIIKEVWNNLGSTNLKRNEVLTIGIFTEVQEGDHIDWIPTIYGVEVEQWAEFIGSTLYEEQDSNGDHMSTRESAFQQSFTIGASGNNTEIRVDGVSIELERVGTVGNYQVKIEGTSTGLEPNGTVYYEGSFAGSSITIGGENWYNFTMTNIAGFDLQPSTQYSLVIYVPANDNISNYLNWELDSGGGNPYSGGYASRGTVNGTGTWASIGGEQYDASFQIWGNTLFGFDDPPTITLNSPTVDANYSVDQDLVFNFTASDDFLLSDVKLYVGGVLNQTNASGINNTNYIFQLNVSDGDYTVLGKATDNASQETDSSSVRIVIDSTPPTLSNTFNLTNLTTFNPPLNSTWHYNASDEHLDSCYYNSTANASQTLITCNSTINTQWPTGGNKTITFCANDTFGLESCNTEYIYIYYLQETQADSPDPVVESFDATFNLTVNLTDIPLTTATLSVNNTIYAPTTTTAGVNGYYFEAVVTIPEGWGNITGISQDWFWNYTINGVITDELTDTENITVYELAIDDCSSYGEIIFNFSILDEETLNEVYENLTIDAEAQLTLTSKANASQFISYSNTWSADNNPQICVPSGVINNSQYWMDLTVGFSSTDRVWEFFYIDRGTLNSTKIYENFNGLTDQDVNLMDLLTADSTSFLFNYFDIDGLAVDGAIVHVMRKYIGGGEFLEVERAKQDQNGDTIVHLVEEDVIYFFLITKDGELLFTSSTYTALCQATPCTIQIEASSGSATFPTDWDLIEGGAYSISSSSSTRIVTLEYDFNESDTINLTVYKYNSDGSYSIVDTNSSTGLAGSTTVTVPLVAGNVSFFASVTKGEDFKNSEWIDLEQKSRDSIGITLGLFLSALIILSLGLMTISEGGGTIIYIILGIFISGALGLMTTELSTGVSVTVYLVVAGGMLLWKFTRRRQ